jgi:hypothetical protein
MSLLPHASHGDRPGAEQDNKRPTASSLTKLLPFVQAGSDDEDCALAPWS